MPELTVNIDFSRREVIFQYGSMAWAMDARTASKFADDLKECVTLIEKTPQCRRCKQYTGETEFGLCPACWPRD